MPMGVTDPTVDGDTIVDVNQSFLDLFGYTRDGVLGQSYFCLAGSSTVPVIEANIRAAMTAKEPPTQEVLLYTKSGQEVWAGYFVNHVHRPRCGFSPFFGVVRAIVLAAWPKHLDNLPAIQRAVCDVGFAPITGAQRQRPHG